MKYILSIDQGTTSSRAILFDKNMQPVATAQQEFKQIFPASGLVEHDPEEIWQSTVDTCNAVLDKISGNSKDIIAIGITNQRETTIIWDKDTGKPIYNAIVWQDRRTSDYCQKLKSIGHEPVIIEKTGLLLDPYFSASKIKWILDNVKGAKEKATEGKLLFGTVDCFLLWRLTEGRSHKTDATNASRTMLYNIKDGHWDNDLCSLFEIPVNMLPEVMDCAADFGNTSIFGHKIPIFGIAGDQQAATIGQACFEPGMMKSTYGTGCFALLNTGSELIHSKNRLLSTIAYQLDGKVTYALEGSIFIAGAVVQWLRDGLKIIEHASDADTLAQQSDQLHKLIMVPAFTGLGAPYWDANCRGAIYGLTRNSGPAEFSRAALESVAYQTCDLLEAMKKDIPHDIKTTLRVDGGMTSSNWTMQFLADMLNAPIDRPANTETTALGAAWLAGMRAGFYPNHDEFAKKWQLEKRFISRMEPAERDKNYCAWQDAIKRTLS
ncbi:MAG: glycerol kinase GlpK [Kordiimonadaceae bacterium]|jgi:glycerol kinase|nr:glycerol kinase GlpK [Kordiimonadaceae bacterium]MBT6031067.1 glycerol kinase GlpK [Kordiimonadaceae bacterium]